MLMAGKLKLSNTGTFVAWCVGSGSEDFLTGLNSVCLGCSVVPVNAVFVRDAEPRFDLTPISLFYCQADRDDVEIIDCSDLDLVARLTVVCGSIDDFHDRRGEVITHRQS